MLSRIVENISGCNLENKDILRSYYEDRTKGDQYTEEGNSRSVVG